MLAAEIRGGEPPDDVAKACPAVGRRHVRRALRQRVNHGIAVAERLFPCAETPGWVRRRVVSGRVDETAGGGVERRRRRRADVVEAPGDKHAPVVGGVGQEVPVGVAEDAGVVVHGGALVQRAQLLGVLERSLDAARAGRGVGVPAAERESVDNVRRRAYSAGSEESRRGGGVVGEGVLEQTDVGLIGAVLAEVPGGVAAELPWKRLRSGERHEKKGGGGEAVEEGARQHRHCVAVWWCCCDSLT